MRCWRLAHHSQFLLGSETADNRTLIQNSRATNNTDSATNWFVCSSRTLDKRSIIETFATVLKLREVWQAANTLPAVRCTVTLFPLYNPPNN